MGVREKVGDDADESIPEHWDWEDHIDGASNILVRASCFGGDKTRACAELLGSGSRDASVLVVSCSYPADRWLSVYRDSATREPTNLVIVGVGGDMGPEMQGWNTESNTRPLKPDTPVLDGIGNPADFTGLGIKITEYLRAFEEARFDDGPTNITCCFDSLTALLQYAEPERVFRFLHSLTTWIRKTSAIAHYHADPEAHDPQDLARFEPLFDASIDATAGADPGDWRIDTM